MCFFTACCVLVGVCLFYRPMTGYFLFMQTVREKIKADNPEFKVTQISKAVGQQWNSLEDEKKQVRPLYGLILRGGAFHV